MKDAQKPDHVSLNTLILRLKEGRFVIPDFQREFEWKPWDIRDLMRSIFLDYYIGSLLLWRGKKENFDALSCEAIYGFNGDGRPESIVLDGQQRLTAIYYAFLAPAINLPSRSNQAIYTINIEKFMAEIYDEAFGYDWLTQRWKKILGNPEEQFENHIFPLSVVGSGGWDLPNWVQGYEQFWRKKAADAESSGDSAKFDIANQNVENARMFGNHLKGITEQYQISYIELDQDLEIDKVCDIFTQINSRGVRLDIFDLVNALLKPKGLKLKQMWRDAAPRLEFVDTERMNVYILQVMSILRQGYCSPKYLYFLLPGQEKQVRNPDGSRYKEVLIADIAEFEKAWNKAVSALESAIKVLQHPQEFGAIKSDYLPYVSILPAFAALQAHVNVLPAARQLDAQRKIRHWYWASVFNNRYSGAVESTTARDFIDLKAWIDEDALEPSFVFEFANTFRNLDLRKETKRGTSVYNGIFNLLVLQGARDWMKGTVPLHNNLDDHHIVPASWGAEHVKGGLIHTILNRTPMTAETNRLVIRGRLPNAYLPELIRESGEATVRAILESHFISPAAFDILLREPFTPEDFEAFITDRQRTIIDAIENLLIKERLDLTPQLRELDAAIEQVELPLRQVIEGASTGDLSSIPPHVLQKVDVRLSRALKKNAALNGEHYQTLAGKLEYFGLRELQDTITSKALWPNFETIFANKETLIKKFDQLAELRNGIRHSRSVDEITRKEGEAAILWFNQVLKK
ncbi:GmrSD restriction endonuclease domain-containing protein [Desulfobacca acetoxidans]|uniref:GmrSD restriction endonucleases N-terminal domain-containing protein n=1 Tax=Desulfobacca acetoxidans (strain ATCC 700848 / DSM 11109 / ASRB2) TaxID=880072 RepID=F2NJ17_DESAR|nr:DUF262 domain-containing protein [Desulfobacca acetoxidans]AEB07975.1 Protein of unknown function DUF2081 [Desulfobacca acetoxidans DSM 11109]